MTLPYLQSLSICPHHHHHRRFRHLDRHLDHHHHHRHHHCHHHRRRRFDRHLDHHHHPLDHQLLQILQLSFFGAKTGLTWERLKAE